MGTSLKLRHREAGRWLTRNRVIFPACIVLLVESFFLWVRVDGAYVRHMRSVAALGWDFAVFWSASFLSIHRGPASAFDWTLLGPIVLKLQGLAFNDYPTEWVYPPTFLLMVWPLSLLPFVYAYVAFVLGGFALLGATCARIAERRLPVAFWFAALAFPAVWIAGMAGQNSFLTAALIGLGLVSLDRRPVVAGICFGLLAMKPQLAMAIPVALICGRRWHALAAAAVTASLFCIVAGVMLGFDTYTAFVRSAGRFGAYLVDRAGTWPAGMPTVFGAARHAGFAPGYAYALHFTVAAIAIGATAWLWLRPARQTLQASALVIASLLCPPYLLTYDLVWLALPFVYLWLDGQRHRWLVGDLLALIAAWLSPIAFFLPLRLSNAVPVVLLAMLAVIVRRSVDTALSPDATSDMHAVSRS
ncbi:glycosyltransferase family 87 protein [Burkholderia pseudomultivorans]|uniref:PF09594 family protein n=1 Tax=Burkholderia pseudomultivorans TaxID=1207504 RepID=A0A6P2Q5V2_9BURK|nr:glycosyltransferase family 87 protein [Burkholderia pseudomultivorans]MDR8729712.1 hypothetical protein [Burkholderia pseudomultivorans]MDR8737643.1 hypothetical protein [Burkholderia pseudomultivorans]MDR8743832.1 hypothetical protein [Burkholderia pseudomultivorans]MDR8755238.1 hypothetical protein [Burkholderia pseudomultivorans]MDR8780363.1 hypothetical protein [Burkholderia pseudomultivorans]